MSERFSEQNQTTVLDWGFWGFSRKGEGAACRAVVLAFGQLFVCPQFVAEHNCGMRADEEPSTGLHASAWFDFIVTMLLAACVLLCVCISAVCVCVCVGPRLIDATSFDFPSVSCDGGLDGRPRWVSHKVFMSSVCLSVPLLLHPPVASSLSFFMFVSVLYIAFALC